jgi:FlaA1/EpsC-like NDP-sugar epimerase
MEVQVRSKKDILSKYLFKIEKLDKGITYRGTVLFFLDMLLVNLAAIGALALRFDFSIPSTYIHTYFHSFIIITAIMLITYYKFNLYKSLWRYASIDELISIIVGSFIGSLFLFIISLISHIKFPRSFYLLFLLLSISLIGGTRFTYRALRRAKTIYIKNYLGISRVLIVGAGKAGSMVIKEMYNNPQIKKHPVAIVDDDTTKCKRRIHGVPVLGTRHDIHKIVEEKKIDEIIIAIPSSSKKEIKEILDICKETKCKLRTLPGVYELIDGKVDIKKIRDVDVEDLLGREPVKVDLDEICGYIENQTVLVTGGGGSIGSELCRQIAKFNPKKLLILDIYENNAYDIQNELKRVYDDLDLQVIIASIRDKKRMQQVFEKYKPVLVFHAAAHKHVPLMEANPTEAIKNNVFGTLNIAELSDIYGVKKFVLISTDKAVNPTNIMGATKRIAEIIVQTMDMKSKTEYVAVRFGNVLGSNGSVIPLFKKQIAEGGPVTVTHPEIIRYFMTIPEAAQLVIQAGAMAKGGEIFVLDMGEPVKILDLARDLIKLSGFEPDTDIKIEFTGLRPGEKLYEELLMAEEGLKETKHEKIFIGKPLLIDIRKFEKELQILQLILEKEEEEMIAPIIKKLVPTYRKVG